MYLWTDGDHLFYFCGLQIKYQESLISSDDAGFSGKNYAIVIRRKLREEEARTIRSYWVPSSSIALCLLEFCSIYAPRLSVHVEPC